MLKTSEILNHETDTACFIHLEVKDDIDFSLEKPFVLSVINLNDPPTVLNPIADQAIDADSSFSMTFDENVFTDEDAGDHLHYTAVLLDDGPLPEWLSFDSINRTFTGIPTHLDAGERDIKVIAIDDSSAMVSDTFHLTVNTVSISPDVPFDDIRLYPEPVSEFLYIAPGNIRLTRISFYSIIGRKVLEYRLDQSMLYRINLSGLENGIYLYILEGKDVYFTGKLTKHGSGYPLK
jgi:hypothetical protein